MPALYVVVFNERPWGQGERQNLYLFWLVFLSLSSCDKVNWPAIHFSISDWYDFLVLIVVLKRIDTIEENTNENKHFPLNLN